MTHTIIFGATGTIGSALAHQITKEGGTVFLAGRDEGQTRALAAKLGTDYGLFDAHDEASIQSIVEVANEKSPITGLIWAVGSILLKPLSKLTAQDYASTYHLNVIAPALAIRDAATHLMSNQGAVLLFSSVAATQGFVAHGAIASAKAAVEGLGRSLAAELSPDIRVNVIAPSLTDSKMAAPLLSNEVMAKGIAAAHPLRRLGEGQDFAALGALLMDNQRAGWITGAVIAVDGGRQSLRVKG